MNVETHDYTIGADALNLGELAARILALEDVVQKWFVDRGNLGRPDSPA